MLVSLGKLPGKRPNVACGAERAFASPLPQFALSVILLVAVFTSPIRVRGLGGATLSHAPNFLRRNYSTCAWHGRALPTERVLRPSAALVWGRDGGARPRSEAREHGWTPGALPRFRRLRALSAAPVRGVVPPLRC